MLQALLRAASTVAVLVLLLTSCGGRESAGKADTAMDGIDAANERRRNVNGCAFDETREFRGVAVRVSVPPEEACSEGTLRISTGSAEVVLERDGPVASLWLVDADADDELEVAVHTVSAGSGSYGRLHLVRLADDGPAPIPIPEPAAGLLEGYMGHDRFEVGPGLVTRTFPVYLDGDEAAAPSGGTRTLRLDVSTARWTRTDPEHRDPEPPGEPSSDRGR